MTLIIGGAYQGKTDYAKERFGFSEHEIIDGESCDPAEAFHAECIKNYHLLIRRLLDAQKDPVAFRRSCSGKTAESLFC